MQSWEYPRGYPSPPLGPPAGTQTPAKKPRSRSILQSLFCCLCRDEAEPCAGTTGAPLLVEENGALPKVTPHPQPDTGGAGLPPHVPPLCGQDWGVNRHFPQCPLWPPVAALLTPVPLLQAAVKHLLPEIKPQDASKLCVVIDLDETLVHSSFKVGDTLAHPTPPAMRPPTCSATLFPQSDAQHPAQPGWLSWGVAVRGLWGGQGCIVSRGQAAFGQGCLVCPVLILVCPSPASEQRRLHHSRGNRWHHAPGNGGVGA